MLVIPQYQFMMTRIVSLLLFCLLFFWNCGGPELGQAPVSEMYADEVEDWYQQRIQSLKEPTGWLRLAGLYILDEGENTFGSAEDQSVRFPEGTIPGHAGTFHLNSGQVTIDAAGDILITHNGEDVRQMTIYDGENSPELSHGSLRWFVIQRGELIAIRLYNTDNPEADQFDGFERYATDPAWYLKAQFNPKPEGVTIPVTNVLGQTEEIPNPGTLVFEAEGQTYSIEALEGADGRLFLIIGDQTNLTETYQAGRYLYVDYPDENGYANIDFNKLYNPPCAYNLYSTCQLPPSSNRLEIAITAGEQRPKDWEGL